MLEVNAEVIMLFLCLITSFAIKAYGGVEEYVHEFSSSSLG
jgi:hypothetical protein